MSSDSTQLVPDEFFIFVNRANFTAMSNYLVTRTFSSRFADLLRTPEGRAVLDQGQVDPMPFIPNENQYPFLSPFSVSASLEYMLEWNVEVGRKAFAPQSPSRLSAVFAFGDMDSCRQVHQRHGWSLDSVRRFVLQPEPAPRVARVNMEVISLMRGTSRNASWDPAEQEQIWRHYWTGGGDLPLEVPAHWNGQARQTLTSGVIWEYLIEGVLVSPDDEPVFPA